MTLLAIVCCMFIIFLSYFWQLSVIMAIPELGLRSFSNGDETTDKCKRSCHIQSYHLPQDLGTV